MNESAHQSKPQLYEALDGVPIADVRRFRRRLKKAKSPEALTAIGTDVDKAAAAVAKRDALIPEIAYPENLPVSARREDIMELVRDNQVVVRPMMYLALSYDHRLIDGKEAVTFLVRVKESLEDPARLVLDL